MKKVELEVKEEFPKYKYHATKAPKLVKSQEEEDALGDSYKDSPADFGVITHPGDEHSHGEPAADHHKKHLNAPHAVMGSLDPADHVQDEDEDADEAPAGKPVEKLNKAELVQYAFDNFKLQLDINLKREELLKQVLEAQASKKVN
jgi:hypothetical protein